jgi:hypothetical protein
MRHMPYARIPFAHIKDPLKRELFNRADDFLADVYSMLGNHRLKRTGAGGCNLTATLVLMCVVDALAKYIYPRKPRNRQGPRFKKLIIDRLPWGSDADGWMRKEDAAELFYVEFRNPLTHALGKDRASKARRTGFVEPTAGIWGNIRTKRIGAVDARKTWPANCPVLTVLTDAGGTRDKLTVAALYWAVKSMVKDLAAKA